MKFTDFEKIMINKGVVSLAEIARKLNTTPQAVSNWKARDQVPHHIAVKIKDDQSAISFMQNPAQLALLQQEKISFSHILIIIAEQLKLIAIVAFISVFVTFTYVKFIKQPLYVSRATVLLPDDSGMNLGGLAGLASQFGVQVPSASQADLSSPMLFPDLIKSRTFAEQLLDKKFYSEKFGSKRTLLDILTLRNASSKNASRNVKIVSARGKLGKIVKFNKNLTSPFSVITVTTTDPTFSKILADSVLFELESLNRFYKTKSVNEKVKFIENRITSVDDDLKLSEKQLKIFNEQNRQLTSPSLQLEQDRLSRGLDIQKGIYLTLKQQLELAKIEQIKQTSVMQVLDYPQVAIDSSNINTRVSVFISIIVGLAIGITLGFFRNYLDNDDLGERKRIRKIKSLFNAKVKDLFNDYRVSGIISFFFLIGMPVFLSNKSPQPDYFGLYSSRIMIINSIYLLLFICSGGLYLYLRLKNKNDKK